MSDLIERKEVIKAVGQSLNNMLSIQDGERIAKALIKGIPSIDIVRCKDCKNWVGGDTCWGIPFSGDDASYIGTEANDFCSYGERKTDHE